MVINAYVPLHTGICTMYARYKFVEKLSADTKVVSPRLNKSALVFGLLSCLGMCVVATFQVCLHTCGAHSNHMEIIYGFKSFSFYIAGNSSDSSSWFRSSAVLCHWYLIHRPAGCYIILCLSIRLVHGCVSSTFDDRRPRCFGLFSQYPFTEVYIQKQSLWGVVSCSLCKPAWLAFNQELHCMSAALFSCQYGCFISHTSKSVSIVKCLFP